MKINHVLLILPLVALVGLSLFYIISDIEVCETTGQSGVVCHGSGYIVGTLTAYWIVLYGIPVGVYFLIRRKKKGSK